MRKKVIGYTEGVFDLFHVGHVNLLRDAKKHCDVLIVGVYADKIVKGYKKKYPIINQRDRISVIENIQFVDKVRLQTIRDDKLKTWKKIKYDILFIGDDWKGTERWKNIERILGEKKVEVKYIPYTKRISSTAIKKKLVNPRFEKTFKFFKIPQIRFTAFTNFL